MNYSSEILEEIQKSIDECEKQTSVEGSSELYNRLIAKFTVIDSRFEIGLPQLAKVSTLDSEPDYRPEIRAIQDKLKMILVQSGGITSNVSQKVRDKIEALIASGETAYSAGYSSDDSGIFDDCIKGPLYDTWTLEIEVFSRKYLKNHPLYEKIISQNGEKNKAVPSAMKRKIDCLRIISKDDDFFSDLEKREAKESQTRETTVLKEETNSAPRNKVFLVHGHDNEMKQTVARLLEKANLDVIILHEQPNQSMTIIEKIEKYTDVTFGIVLYSPCDVGRASNSKQEDEKPRARQNVVFEHGYLYGRLGRDKVCALLKGDVEKPSDIDGVLYITMDDRGAWKLEVAREMKNAGLNVDLAALL